MRNASYFEHNFTRLHYRYPIFHGTFTFTHPYFGWFFGNRLIRENFNPQLPFSFHISRSGNTRSFDLSCGDPRSVDGFNSESSIRELCSSLRISLHLHLMNFTEFGSSWL